jgi:hypothetical protein
MKIIVTVGTTFVSDLGYAALEPTQAIDRFTWQSRNAMFTLCATRQREG